MNILDKVEQLEKYSKELRFYWPDFASVMEQVTSEIEEVKEAFYKDEGSKRLQEELGDLLHAVCSLIYYCEFGLEETLAMSLEKYSRRVVDMQKIAAGDGVEDFKQLSLKQMMQFWDKAKMAEVK